MFRLFQNKHEKLIEVIKAGNEAEAQQLIAQMNITELSKVDDYGKTALLWAAYKGLEKVCEALIPKMSQQAIDNVVKDGFFKGHTALSIAKDKGFKNICDLLTHKIDKQNNPAIEVNKQGELQTNLNVTTKIPHKKLIEAIQAKNEAEARKLIAEMNITELSKADKDGNTALTLAAMNGHEKVCKLLIPKMTEQAINQVTNNGCTALILAAEKGLEKVCELLIPKMTEQAINQVTNNGYTALTAAALQGLEKGCELHLYLKCLNRLLILLLKMDALKVIQH